MHEDLKKAGSIAKKVLDFSKTLLKPEVRILEIAEAIEQKIIDLGGFPAFPVNISINNIAAHYTPSIDDPTLIKEGDVVKIDFGVHINGYIVDLAYTEEINDSKYKDLIEASKKALIEVKKIIKDGIEVSEIGKKVEEVIRGYGYKPIYNLFGHKIDRYLLHAGINIPNFNNNSKVKLECGVYAIEPFATNGLGFVEESKGSGIYSIINIKPVRDRKIKEFLDYLYNKYKNLPFAYRWVYNEFKDKINVKLYIEYLKKENILYEYPILVEKSGGVVSQHETTFFICRSVEDLVDFL